MILGAVLAGGQASRFGSDKALAALDGRALIDLAVEQLAACCDGVVVIGRSEGPAPCLPDWPGPGMGPLGGIAGALRAAQDGGYAAVLTCGVDSPLLPPDILTLLEPAPAYAEQQPVIGLWPASALAAVEAILAGPGKHSLRALAERIGARPVRLPVDPVNINTPDDLAAAARRIRDR